MCFSIALFLQLYFMWKTSFLVLGKHLPIVNYHSFLNLDIKSESKQNKIMIYLYIATFILLMVSSFSTDGNVFLHLILSRRNATIFKNFFLFILETYASTQESILASNLGKTQQVVGSCKILQDGRLSRIQQVELQDLAFIL